MTCAAPPACASSGVGGRVDGWILVIDLELKTSNRDLDEANERDVRRGAVVTCCAVHLHQSWMQRFHVCHCPSACYRCI